MKLFFSFFSLLFFVANFTMENAQVTYHQEHYIPSRSHMIRIIARFNGHEVGRLVPEGVCCNRIGQLWVAENMRKKGIAKEMLVQFAAYCRKQNWTSVEGVIDPNDPIKGYFEKLSKLYPIEMTQFSKFTLLIEYQLIKPTP